MKKEIENTKQRKIKMKTKKNKIEMKKIKTGY